MIRAALIAALGAFLAACSEPPVSGAADELFAAPRGGEIVIRRHPGGIIDLVFARLVQLDADGVSVKVTGGCYSACVMSLSELFQLNCSSDYAAYHFHGAAAVDIRTGRVVREINDRDTIYWRVIPASVQDALPPPEKWVSTRWNVLTARQLKTIQGSGYRGCL